MESSGIKPIFYNRTGNDLSYYTYLKDVVYQVEARFEWNTKRPDLKHDWNEHKHFDIAKRSIALGGRRDIFLGTRECQGYVEPCEFGEGEGAYDETPELALGMQFHSYIYPDESLENENNNLLKAAFWKPVMKNGVIEFVLPQDAEFQRELYEMEIKEFRDGINYSSKEVK